MIFINEWLPNPNGADAKGEFVELFNNGAAPVNLGGWFLEASNRKKVLVGAKDIAADGYFVLKRSDAKFSLKNSDERLALYDASGRLVDQSSFLGQAASGQSFSRINYTADASEHFAWGDPTPGMPNKIVINTSLAANSYPAGVPLGSVSGFGTAEFFVMLLGVGAILAALVLYFLKRDENLSKLFFPRDSQFRHQLGKEDP